MFTSRRNEVHNTAEMHKNRRKPIFHNSKQTEKNLTQIHSKNANTSPVGLCANMLLRTDVWYHLMFKN